MKPAPRPRVHRCLARRGFTIIELLVVALIIAMGAALCMDMFQGNKYEDVDAGVRMLRADIEFARVRALASPSDPVTLNVYADGSGYRIAYTSAPTTPITGPNGPLALTFGTGRGEACPGLRLTATGSQVVTFGPFGGISDPVPTLTLTLLDSGERATLVFDPFTGDSTVTYQSP